MNSKQKFAFLLGVIAIATMGLYPPWKEAGPKGLPMTYAPIFAPPVPLNPENGLEIDLARLLLQVGVAAVLTGGLVAAAAPSPAPGSAAPTTPQLTIVPPSGTKTPTQLHDLKRRDEEDEEDEDEDEDEDGEPEVEDGPNVIRLPAGKVYGEFLVESDDDPDYWEELTPAKGVVKLPANKRIQLEVKNNKDVDLSFLMMVPQTSLHSVDLSESAVKDWELAHLQRLTDLKELDLSSTKITNDSIPYLKGLNNLEKLWLDSTAVDDSCIDELKTFSSLKKLSLKGTKVTKNGISKLQENLTDCKIES